MASDQVKDLEFDISESLKEPFIGTLNFRVQKSVRIVNFEFSTHDMGCCRTTGRDVEYGLKLTHNGKILLCCHKADVDMQVKKTLILEPGNTYKLETWVGKHPAPKPGQVVRHCDYHYAQILRSEKGTYEPFEFVFTETEDNTTVELLNRTCVYVISYEIIADQ